jgi:hypothetical protein
MTCGPSNSSSARRKSKAVLRDVAKPLALVPLERHALLWTQIVYTCQQVIGGRVSGAQGEKVGKGLDLGGFSAQSVILMLIVIALTVLQFRYVERRVQ